MVSEFSISVHLNIPRDLLWRVRATKTFMQFLVSNGAINRMEATRAQRVAGSDSRMSRIQTYVPAEIRIPDVVKPIFDDSYLEIKDRQTWDEEVPYEQTFDIKPGIMCEVVKSGGTLTLEASGNKDEICVHTLAGQCRVSIPFLGWYVEQAIIDNMKHFYKGYAKHIDDFVNMVVHKYGDGSVSSLRMAIDRLCADEKCYGEDDKERNEFENIKANGI